MFIEKIKDFIPEQWKRSIRLHFASCNNTEWAKYASDKRRHIYIFLAGFYQNLGDMAITYAEIQFLTKIYPDTPIIPIASTSTYLAVKTIKSFIRPDDLIMINGGGNMDDKYLSLEEARRYVVKSFPDNPIVSFPQTIFFSETELGKKTLEKSRKVYLSHSRLLIFAREMGSYERVKNYFPSMKIGLCPDMVLSMDEIVSGIQRKGVLCCLRKDKEQNINEEQKQQITKILEKQFDAVQYADTIDVRIEDCSEEKYKHTLNVFWNKIRQSQLVVTDRLHCMLFCVITATPCIVFDNSNHKNSDTYNTWLKNISNIFCCNDFDLSNFEKQLNYILSSQFITFCDLDEVYKRFEQLQKVLTALI